MGSGLHNQSEHQYQGQQQGQQHLTIGELLRHQFMLIGVLSLRSTQWLMDQS